MEQTEVNAGNPSYLEGNAKRSEKPADEEREVKPVVQGKMTKRKVPAAKRLRESLGLEETRTVGDYLVWDVLLPAAKETIADVVKKGIDVFLYGGTGGYSRGNSRGSSASHVSYEGYYSKNRNASGSYKDRKATYNPRSTFDFREFVFDDKRDADMVLNELCEIVDVYGFAKVSDFYDLVGETERNFTLNGYGWEALGSASVERVRDGWVVDLPRPVPLRG